MSNPSSSKTREWKTIPQASAIRSLSRSVLYKLMTAGQLEYSVVGRCRRIPLDALQKLMEAGTVPATASAH
jgi:excisionase family DNA binding protein